MAERAGTAPTSVANAVSRMVGQDLSDVAVWRDDAAESAAAGLDARAFTAAGEVNMPLQRGAFSDRRAAALLAHELTHVAQQRRAPLGIPSEGSPHGRRLEAEALSVERSVLRHGVTATRPRTVTPPPAPPLVATRPPTPPAPVVASTATPGLQRAEDRDPALAAAEDGAGDRSGFEHADLDELARRLYGRLRRQLRDELLLDRERVGLGAGGW